MAKQEVALVTQPNKAKKNAIQKLAERLDLSTEVLTETLKASAFSLCKTNEQFVAAVIIANTYGLNPILREMYAFPGQGGGVIPIVGFDGWVKIVNRQPNFNGVELIENEDKDGELVSVTAKFYIKGNDHPVVVTEYLKECMDATKTPWKRWPRRMLRHKAYIQGARVAFGFAGIYDEDEGERIKKGQEADIIESPVIGLKNDKNKPSPEKTEKAQLGADSAESQGKESPVEGEIVPKWDDFGDPERFGANGKTMLANLKKCADKLGQEKFMEVIGTEGFESVQQITKVTDLAKITNALLDIVAGK